jgi:Domain of unknown function (DUF1905)/Bacteriocin-protection, YdeI or OmpD-Associated
MLQIFAGKIYKIGIIRYVDVPLETCRELECRGSAVPVRGTVDGVPLRTTLVSRGNGAYRLAIHGDIRKKLRMDTGAVVEIALEIDYEPREPALPPAMVVALRNAPKAQANFRAMTTALRRQIVRYITSVKQQSTLERRVAGIVRRLETREEQARAKQKKHKQSKKRYKS